MRPRRVILSWSSGKDSAWALDRLREEPGTEVVALLTSFNERANRVSMHAVRRELVEAQAAALDLPLWPVLLPVPCPNEIYEREMGGRGRRNRAEWIVLVSRPSAARSRRELRIRQSTGTEGDPRVGYPLRVVPLVPVDVFKPGT